MSKTKGDREPAWQPFHAACCEYCGGSAEVLTTTGKPNLAYDADEARCVNCQMPGQVVADDAFGNDGIAWHDEPGCECEWCRAHPDDWKLLEIEP